MPRETATGLLKRTSTLKAQGNGHTYGRHGWVVPADTPDELFYQSGLEAEVFGKIIVVD